MAGTGAFCCLPILLWNMQHHWVSLLHVGGQAGLRDTEGIRWLGPLTYVGTQFGLLLGFWFVAWVSAMIAHWPWQEGHPGVRYLWWMSAPMFGVFLLFSVRATEEPNWPITAYISGLVLTIAWIVRQMQTPLFWYRRLTTACLAVACALGLMLSAFMHQRSSAQPVLLAFQARPQQKDQSPCGGLIRPAVLRGRRTLAAAVDRERDKLRAEGIEIEPVIAGSDWTLPGELGFYCADHPAVYCLGPALGDRFSQYDFWRPSPVWDDDKFAGRTFILIGHAPVWFKITDNALDALRREAVPEAILSKLKSLKEKEFETRDKLSSALENILTNGELERWREMVLNHAYTPALREAFEEVETVHTVVYREHGQQVSSWPVTICRRFRGFSNLPGWLHGKHF